MSTVQFHDDVHPPWPTLHPLQHVVCCLVGFGITRLYKNGALSVDMHGSAAHNAYSLNCTLLLVLPTLSCGTMRAGNGLSASLLPQLPHLPPNCCFHPSSNSGDSNRHASLQNQQGNTPQHLTELCYRASGTDYKLRLLGNFC